MSNILPSNPSTICDTRRRANTWSPLTVARKYAGRQRSPGLVADIQSDLRELSAWDTYERRTSARREAVKATLLALAHGASQDEGTCTGGSAQP